MSTQDQSVFIFLFLSFLAIFVQSTRALDYVDYINVTDITTSSAVITWNTPDDVSDTSHYVLQRFVDDENIQNDTIALGTTSFTLTGLRYHKFYTYELMTISNSGVSLGSSASVRFLTLYDPMNRYAVAAVVIAITIFLLWVIFFILRKKCDPHAKNKILKTEILEMQKREKEEKRKKISQQVLVNVPYDNDA